MDDAADHTAIFRPFDAPDIRRQVRLNPLPLLIAQPKQILAHIPIPFHFRIRIVFSARKNLMSSDPSITVVIFCWRILLISESMGHHDSEIMDDRSID